MIKVSLSTLILMKDKWE